MTEQEYILINGGDDIIGQSIFMQRSAASQKSDYSMANELNKKLQDIAEINSKLRKEFREKVKLGEIHKDTIEETLYKAAQGHIDNQATSAALRCLKKRGLL